jgi:hypothetical protein
MDQADPSCGSSGEGVNTGAFAAMSLASRELRPLLGVLTLEVEAVVTASPSMVDGGRPFQRLEGLPWLGIEDSDQAGCSNFDMATAIVRRTDERG